jgi:glycosyltransferase involved in cell wall biosynthesis
VFVGRFHAQKGIHDLLRIWKLVTIQKPDARLAVIGFGDRSEMRRIKSELREMRIGPNIDLHGYIDGKEKVRVIKASRVAVIPSYYESWGIVVAEALACRVPVVAYNLPAFKEVYGEKILYAPLGDVKRCSKQILRLLNNHALSKRVALEGAKFIKDFDWSESAEKTLSYIDSL